MKTQDWRGISGRRHSEQGVLQAFTENHAKLAVALLLFSDGPNKCPNHVDGMPITRRSVRTRHFNSTWQLTLAPLMIQFNGESFPTP